jgi:hypothetical protein
MTGKELLTLEAAVAEVLQVCHEEHYDAAKTARLVARTVRIRDILAQATHPRCPFCKQTSS